MTRIAVVMTVFNEVTSIDRVLDSLATQTRQPDEIVVVDGGSTDGTVEALRARGDYRLTVISRPGANISEGRNVAIATAGATLIAVTDAGTEMRPDWLQLLADALEAGADVAGGFFVASGRTPLERAIAIITTPQIEEINPLAFLPSSRSVAFRRGVFEEAGGYPEWLQHCEDLVLDLSMKAAGATFAFVPEAVVTWSARPTLRTFVRQYYLYARGDGHADLWRKRHAARYTTYLGSIALASARPRCVSTYAMLAVGAVAYLQKFVRRVLRRRAQLGAETLFALAVVPLVVVSGDLGKLVGYAVGLLEGPRVRRGRPRRA